GGPVFSTTINQGFSGFEQRNRNWQFPLCKYEVSLNDRPLATFQLIQNFFWNVYGQADAFRFFDHTDYSATAQVIAVGDGSTKTFQLVKSYVAGSRTMTRLIKKPIMATANDYQG